MKCIIITGGGIDTCFAKEYIKTLSYDKVFAVDKGLNYAKEMGIMPDVIMGDFDSVDDNVLEEYKKLSADNKLIFERFPVMKDATDTELAVDKAIESGAMYITILGATGGARIDHMLGNISLLKKIYDKNVECVMVDAHNRIRYVSTDTSPIDCVIKKDLTYDYKYLSFIVLSKELIGLTLSGVAYPVDNITVPCGTSYLVSNEINDKAARIRVGKGAALIIESKE
ncbi:MAG: thiamine diphosphokinase [Lachnospiraceae bacterium]|jgi:thiamine pyrophosphokinase|nr:thiamine diphosphokinase [Lachnospiraceae bacterium]